MQIYFEKLYSLGNKEFYELVEKTLKNKRKMFIVTANPETFSYGQNDKMINELLLDSKTTLVPDGIGIVKAAHILNYNVKERITGIDLAQKLLEIANENQYKVALLGATSEVINKLRNKISLDFPKINLVKAVNGYIEDKDKFLEEIVKTKPDICLVAIGIPNQEKLIYKHLDKFEKGIFVGVGGSFDVLSGTKKRAPKIIQKLNIEWLYRILKEPKRIKRFYNNNVKFMFKINKLKKQIMKK